MDYLSYFLGSLLGISDSLLDGLHNTDGNGLSHITHCKAAKGCILSEGFNALKEEDRGQK